MKIAHFATEHFFDKYEFSTPYQLCNSDCETISVDDLLQMAGVPLADFGRLTLGYTQSHGSFSLRESIAACYQDVDADEVLFLGSPIEGIYLAACAVLNPGDEVIVLTPAYDALINMFEHVAGADHVHRWRFKPGKTQWELDFDELESMVTPATRMLVVNFPHNPTGFSPSPAQVDQLINTVNKHNLVMFYDEMYYGLRHQDTPFIPSAADFCPHAIVLSGLSKTYGLPGLRSGWLVIHDRALLNEMVNWKFYTSICPPVPTEFLTITALRVREQLCARSQAQINTNLSLADAFFARHTDLFTWRKPLSGSTALVEMHVPSVTDFSSKMALEAGILIQPATTLGWTDQSFRMGLGRASFGVALQKFEDCITKKMVD